MSKTLLPKSPHQGRAIMDYENPTPSGRFNLQRYWYYSLLLVLGILCQANIASAQMGKAITLNGTSDYVNLGTSLTPTGNTMTIEAWARPTVNNGYIVGNENTVAGTYYLRFAGASAFQFFVCGVTIDVPIASIPLNQWTHVAGTYNGTTAILYLNGQIAGSAAVTGNLSNTGPTYIGECTHPNGSGRFWTGQIDEVRLWSVARTQEQIQENMNRTLTGTETGLMGYYNMDAIAANGQGQTVTDLATGNGAQNGTTVGTANSPLLFALDANTTWANILHFDGVNDFVNLLPNTGAWNTFASAITIETWANPEAYGSNGTIFSRDNGSGTYAFGLRYEGSNLSFFLNVAGAYASITVPSTLTPLNQWSHIAGVYDGTNMKIYINGALVETTAKTGTINNASIPIHIGATPNVGNYYKGSLDEFRVWNVARTQTEIQQNMNSVSPSTSGLVAYYPFNQGTANGANTTVNTLTDVGPNAFNGILQVFNLTGTTSNWLARTMNVTTPVKSSVAGTTAVLGATLTTYVPDLVEKGIVYSTSSNVSLTNGRKSVSSGMAAGAYSLNVTNLKVNTKYYYRGYAFTNNDIRYSSVDSFTIYSDLGNALAFDGVDDHFYIGSGLGNYTANPVLNTISTALTLEIWIKPRDYSAQRFLNRQDQNNTCWVLEIVNGSLSFYTNSTTNGNKFVSIPTSYIPLNQWTHIAGVYDGTQMILYINGVSVGTVAQSGALHTSSLYAVVGCLNSVGGYFNGVMDEVRIWNVARTQAQIQANMSAPISATSTGLICYFPFDQGVANAPNPTVTIPVEAVSNLPVVYGGNFSWNGNTSNWVAHSGAAFASTSANNNALDFDGTNDYITIPGANLNNQFAANQITVEGWCFPTLAATGSPMLFGNQFSGGNIKFAVIQNASGLLCGFFNGSSWVETTPVPIVLNQWQHFAATYDQQTLKLYINGALAASIASTQALPNSSLDWYIGKRWDLAEYYKGQLDEIRVWNVARTQAQIQANANVSIPAGTAGLVLYYPFNQGVAAGNNTAITTSTSAGSLAAIATLNNFALTGATSNFVYGSSLFDNVPDGKPIITNVLPLQATFTSASAVGSGVSIQEQGFLYNAGTTVPTMASGTKITSASTASGSFSATPTSLVENQLYTVRSYIATAAGVLLSPPNTFATPPCPTYSVDITLTAFPTAATVTWTTSPIGAAAYSWKVVNSGAGANGTAVTSGTTTNTTLNITGLTPDKNYDFYLLITGCATTTWSDARPFSTKLDWRNALHFDGTDDYVDAGNVTAVNNLTSQATFEAWVRPENIGGTRVILNKDYPAGYGYGINLALVNGVLTASITTSSVLIATVSGTTPLTANQWAHIAAVYNGATFVLYVNGKQVASRSLGGNISTNPGSLFIGRRVNGDYFSGMIDEVKIWNVARTQNQIFTSMNSGVLANTAGLILDYSFNEGTPNGTNTGINIAKDSSATAANGTLNGFSLANNTSNWVARAPYIMPPVPVSAISVAGPTVNGNVNQTGTGTIVERGFIWNQGTATPTFGTSTKVVVTGTTTGAFSAVITGLTLGQTYTFRPYGLSTDGYYTSAPATFVMELCGHAPALNTIVASNITPTSATFSWAIVDASYDWVVTKSGFDIANPVLSGNSTTGTVNLTGLEIGINYDFFLRGNCTTTQSPWQNPVTFQTLAVPTFTTNTVLNDAYVDLNWTLHPLPCLINNGTPYAQGIYVKVTDLADGKVLKQEPITNLAPFIGAQQPTFNYVASDSLQGYTCTVSNTNGWQNYSTSTWTIETWVKGNNGSNNAEIFRANLGNNIAIKVSGATIAIQKNAVATNFSTPLPLGKWKHLAFTYDGGTVSLFIDGVKKEQKAIANLVFGGGTATYSVANNFTNMQMGEIRYWNRVRTDVEIADNRWVTAFTGLIQNNLLMHLRWNSNNAAPVDLATNYDGQNNTVTYSGPGTLQTLPYITTPDYTPIVGTFRHYVGPTKSKNYKLEVFQIGSGAAISSCTNLTTTGSTIAFQQPTAGTATTNLLDRIRLQWTNKSKLSETFKIFRGGVLRGVIAGSEKLDSVFTWEDVYSADDSLSIVNGTSYSYCIETYCNNLNSAYAPQLCRTGNTFNLNFTASDNWPSNKVNLSWANVASYNYNIQIKRDGILIATLPAATVTYADANPIYGKVAKYEVCLIDPDNSELIVSKADNGSVPARGVISGRASTYEGNYALKNVRVKLHSLVDTLVNLTTYTDYLGNFSFNNLYYEFAGQFELTADYGNHIFVGGTQTVTLNDSKFAVTNVAFFDSTGLTVSATPLNISNFQGVSMQTQDKINFAWAASLSAGDTVLYDVYREATRIATLTNLTNALSYIDLGGQPNVSYKYKLSAYKIKNNIITAIELADTLLFPQVAIPTSFTAVANTTLGVINMAWSHTSSNYDGFRIYRNGKQIADLPVGTFAYTDADAKPGTSATYMLKAKRFLNKITFESLGQTVANVNIPALPAVTGVTATASTTRNSVLISWTIPAALIATYNYDGFRVYRRLSGAASTTDVYIGQLPKAINPPFEDKTALSSTAYTYTVKSYLRLSDNSIGESVGASANATCPVVTPVTALTASTTLAGEVALSWTPPAASVRNLDGIVVLRGSDTLAVLPYNANTFRVFTNSTVTTSYSVRVFRNVAGVRRFSAALSASGKAAVGSTAIEFATNVSATQNLANHVRLSWDYPSYVLSTFKIYRDNVLVATLPTETRVYLDNAAVAGTTHFYQVEAINGANTSQRAGAQGRLRSIRELNGMVYSTTDKYGVPNADVYVTGIGYTGHTKTDSSGYYVFAGLPETAGTSMTVFVDGYGTNHTTTFTPTSQTFAISAGANVYTRNFGSSYTPAITDTIAPTRPMNIIATPNPSRRRVSVTWTPSNTYYDGFEVYRANILLANVKKGENLIAYDTAGYPGISYTYQIRSYQYTTGANKYSNFYSTTGTYPLLEAPIFVTATPNLALNTLKLTWSHNWDNHTRYEISRNDSLLTTVNTKAILAYTDNTGIPGQQYVYSIKAVMVVGSKTHYSDASSITVQYPTVAEAGNFTVTTPTLSTSYTTPCVTTVNQERNLVDLNWTYDATALLKGFRVYREQTLLASLPKDSLHYRDYNGIPGNYQAYTIKSILERAGDNYYSQGATASKTYPTLATPQNVTHKDTLGAKQMRWVYPDGGATGFYILRGTAVIDTVLADSLGQKSFVYLDQTGVSGTSYDYTIRAYTKRNDVMYWANDYTCLTGLTYPKPLTPTNVAASDGTYFSYVKISWDYPQGADVTGFKVFRNGSQIATVAGGIKNYFDLSANGVVAYAIQAYKSATFQGTAYTNNSNLSVVDSGYATQAAPNLQYISPTAASKSFGFAVDIESDNLAIGAPNITGVAGTSATVQLWHFVNNTFNYDWLVSNLNYSLLGYDVTTYNGVMLGGMPTGQAICRTTFNATSRAWTANTVLQPSPENTTSLGAAVASSSAGAWFAAPLSTGTGTNQHGMVWNANGYSGAAIGGSYYYRFGYAPGRLGVSIDANANYLVMGDTMRNKLFIENTPNFTNFSQVNTSMELPTPSNLGTYPQFGRAVSISPQDRIIVGAPKALVSGSRIGRAYIYEKQGNSWVLVSTLNSPDGSANDQFGNAVAISSDRAIVGAPNYGGGKGSVYIFERNSSGQWNYAFKYEGIAGYNLGYSVDLNDNYLVAGAPNANSGEGKVAWFNVANLLLSSVSTSQGTLNGQVRVDWTYPASSNGSISGFRVYRDGALLQTAAATDRYFYDANGVAGKHYIYEVCAYTNVGEQSRKAAEGWSKADGYLEGKVVTLMGNGGVGGVNIKASATIEGNDYIYNVTTNSNGEYAIPNVYYGDAITNFTLTADYGDHLFLLNPIYTTLSPQNKSRLTMFFHDKTAYSISGTVGRPDVSTYLDSIRVYGEYIMADSSTEMFTQNTYTTPDGKYSLSFNPYKSNAIGIRVGIDSTRILLTSNGADTLHYRFRPLQTSEFTSLAGFPQNTLLNFEDTLTYPVRLQVFTACRNNVTGGNFKIRVRSKDDSYDKVFVTDLTGKTTVKLPPLQYILNVDGVENNTAANQLVIDYLRYRPQTLDIYTPYKDTLYHQSAAFFDSLTNQEFIYHRPPSITVLSGFDRYLCDNPSNPAIIKQGIDYSLRFQVGEIFNNVPCVSRTGYLVIKNAASTKDIDTIYVNRENGNVDTYKFTGGNPNLVAPHRHTMTLEYRTDIGELVAVKTMAIIVEGAAALPGADVIVDLGNGTVPLPLFTLRDPYGDGSFSTIEEGSTLTKEFGFSTDMKLTTGLSVGFEMEKPIVVSAELDLKLSAGSGLQRGWSLTATTTEAISTSGSEIHVGPKADVIVGAGVALQYGLVQEIKVVNCNNIAKVQKLGFAPHSVQTTWHYTVAQIEELIRQYTIQLQQIEEGTLVILEGGNPISKEAAKTRFNTYKSNWEQILVYHNRETLPWYNLCKKRTDLATYLDPVLLGRYLEWKLNFCPLVGSYDGEGNFNPKDNIVWDQPLVTAYNNTMTATRVIYEVLGPLHLVGEELTKWSYSNGALSDPYKYVDDAYIWLHDLQAQNITYGSGVTIDKSYESAASASTTLKANAGLTLGLNVGLGAAAEALAGWIAETVVAEVEAEVSRTFDFEWNFETSLTSSKQNTNKISYSLSDDDDYDQFSVTAIQGIDPHQTPYFSLLGGRSSCPYEEGTIARDDFSISIYDPETQSTSKSVEIYDVPQDESAVIYVQIANNNPFGEERSLNLYCSRLYNPEGAVVTVFGDVLWEASIINLPSDEPTVVAITIGRGPVAYDYEHLKVFVRTVCSENMLRPERGDTVDISIHFKNECSPIAIAEPDGYWTILKQNVNDPNSREVLPIRLMDYDPSNENLLDVHLEYRRKGNGLTWHQIPSSELSPALLGDWNDENFLASQVPYYMYSWDITGDYQTYPDGEYEVRAVADCGLGGRVYSNIIKGAIERKTNLYGLPQPSDKVWTVGDEISVAFNLDIDCATIADSNFIVQKYGDNTTILPGTVNCANNKLIFNPELSLMQYFDGDTLEMVVGGVRTFNGNLLDTVRWTFLVISRDLYVTNDSLSVELTQGQTADLGTTLVNNIRTGEVLNYHIQNLAGAASWLSCADSTGTVAFNSPKDIAFHINSKEMPIGTTTLNLDIFANGRLYENAIKVSVKVLPKGPDWDFDPSQYSQDMTLVANYNFNNTGVKSTDTTDLISVWIDNKLRGVANINKFTSTLHSAVISVYGNPSDFGKALKFRIWDASAGVEYDARPDANAVISFAPDKIEGSVSSPRLLDVFTASDKVQYIPLNQGWTMFSVNTNRWNAPLNTAIASLRHPHDGDVIKTANKSAEYVSASNSWVSTNGLDSTNVHRGYQIYLQQADTLRITGSAAAISPISLNYGWNFVGYPPQTALGIDTAFTFLGQPDSVTLKTTAQNPTYSRNMVAIYDNSTWKYTSNSDMDMLYPNFAYKMRVNTIGSQLYFDGANASQAPVTLLRTVQETPLNLNKPEEWAVNAPSFEHNMLITGVIDYNKAENVNENSKIAAYVGKECRGVGELVYVKELKRYVTTMMVYSNGSEEEISFYIYNADQNRSYKHHETLTFTPDALVGNYSSPYHFSNVAPDNTFNGSVYPNPFIDGFEVNLKSDKTQDYEIQLLDLTGRVLKKVSVSSDKESFSTSVDTEALDLVEGVYLLQVKGSLGKTLTFKVIHAKQ